MDNKIESIVHKLKQYRKDFIDIIELANVSSQEYN